MNKPRDELVLGRTMPEPSKQYGRLQNHLLKPNKNIVPPLIRHHNDNNDNNMFVYPYNPPTTAHSFGYGYVGKKEDNGKTNPRKAWALCVAIRDMTEMIFNHHTTIYS